MSKNKNKEVKQAASVKESGEFTFMDYFYVNLMFWGFLLVVALIVFFTAGAKWDPIMQNVFTFIFLVFGLGFTGVSIFDAIYDRLSKGATDEK